MVLEAELEEAIAADIAWIKANPVTLTFDGEEIDTAKGWRFEDVIIIPLGGDLYYYYIPFRCLYSRNTANLMMAGRCFSCSHVGLGGPRNMRTLGQMGVATGYAASLCKKHSATPRLVGQKHIKELRGLIGYA